MKLITTLLPLAVLTSAFVIPDEQITQTLISESQEDSKTWIDRLADSKDNFFAHVEETLGDAVAFGENALDNAINAASDISSEAQHAFECHGSMTKFDTQGWLDSTVDTAEDFDYDIFDTDRPHKKPKHGKKPHHGHGHGPSHSKSNKTVYELIASSKYTTKLAKLINEYPDLVETLNGTAANYTVFAPTDKAFEKIPHHGDHKPSKELIKKVLAYHVSPGFYPAVRVLVTHTIPTAVGEDGLGGNPQRLRIGLGLRGLAVNYYSRVIAVDIVCISFPALHSPLTNLLIAREQRCNPRRRFHPPSTPTCPQNNFSPSRRIFYSVTRTRKDFPRFRNLQIIS